MSESERPISSGKLQRADLAYIARGFSLFGLGQVGESLMGFLLSLVLAYSLGAAGLGLYFLGLSLIRIANRLIVWGVDTGMLRYGALYYNRRSAMLRKLVCFVLGIEFALGALVALLVGNTARLIADNFFSKPDLGHLLPVFVLAVPFLSLNLCISQLLRSFKAFGEMAAMRFLTPLLNLVLFAAMSLAMDDALAAAVGSFAASTGVISILWCLIAWKYLRTCRTPPEAGEKLPLREFITFSFQISLGVSLRNFSAEGVMLLLGFYRPEAEIGVFGIALKVSRLLRLVLTPINGLMSAVIVECHQNSDMNKLRSYFSTTTRFGTMIVLPAAIAILVFAKEIMGIFGSEYEVGATALRLLALGGLIDAASGSAGLMLSMTGQASTLMWNTFVSIGLHAGLALSLIPGYGFLGAAAAVLGLRLALNLLNLIRTHQLLGLQPYTLEFLRLIYAAMPLLAGYYLAATYVLPLNTPNALLILTIFAGSAAYLILSLRVGASHEHPFIREYLADWMRTVRQSLNL